ncbi:MAG: hypothetical protein ACI8Y7_000301, partial [Candidatus Woesearchaeota archaeon]
MHVSRKKGLIPTHKLVLFLLIFLTFATSAYAGCCVGPNVCLDDAESQERCTLGIFEDAACETVPVCVADIATGVCCAGTLDGYAAYDVSFCKSSEGFIPYTEANEALSDDQLCADAQGAAQFPPEDTDSDLVLEIDPDFISVTPVFGTSPVPNLLSGKVQPVTLLGDKSLKIQAATSEGTDIT